jgi:hypothetical protein
MMEMSTQAFVCQECGKQFNSQKALNAHLGIHRRATRNNSDNGNNSVSQEVALEAMRMLEDGHSPFEIMSVYKLDVGTMKSILNDYRELSVLARPERSAADIVLEIAKLFGEQIRNSCEYYNDEQGICTNFSLYDVDESLRRSNPGLFKGFGGKTRFHVLQHPWICAFCRKGLKGGGVPW